MIVCHERKIIFVKTKKVGGTSFEIALSKFCGPDCIITPITPADEELRKSLGFRGSQNYIRDEGNQYFNHMTAKQIQKNLPIDIWNTYRKVMIFRNPYDVLISKYFWRRETKNFDHFVKELGDSINENEIIAPFFGPEKLDIYLKYEDLSAELKRHNLDFLIDGMSDIKAKGHMRPAQTDIATMFKDYPELVNVVTEKCENTINLFGYEKPELI